MNSNNRTMVPEAREGMNKFKMEAANQVGVNLKQGYNGHLTSREAGSIGGQMVKNNCPVRTMNYVREHRTAMKHEFRVKYIIYLSV